MDKWLMQVVLVLLVLAAAMGLKTFATQSWNGAIVTNAAPWTAAPTSCPMPVPFGR